MNIEDPHEVTAVSRHEQSLSRTAMWNNQDFTRSVNSSLMPRGAYAKLAWHFWPGAPLTAFFISDPNLLQGRRLCHLGAASHPRLLWRFIFTLLVFLLYMPSPISVHAQSSSAEYQSKAAFIFHFAQLVDWLPEVSGSPDRPLIFCVADENALNVFGKTRSRETDCLASRASPSPSREGKSQVLWSPFHHRPG
jgi:hypothetical protein